MVASFKKITQRGELLKNNTPSLPQIENENIAKGTKDPSLTNSCEKLKKSIYQFFLSILTNACIHV